MAKELDIIALNYLALICDTKIGCSFGTSNQVQSIFYFFLVFSCLFLQLAHTGNKLTCFFFIKLNFLEIIVQGEFCL